MEELERKTLKMADWARLIYDKKSVEQRILFGNLRPKWGHLSEDEKQSLTRELSDEVADIHKFGSKAFTDENLVKYWPEIADLNKYGIFL